MPSKDYCFDCRWCRTAVDLDEGSNYFCDKRAAPLAVAMVWRLACKDFVAVKQLSSR